MGRGTVSALRYKLVIASALAVEAIIIKEADE